MYENEVVVKDLVDMLALLWCKKMVICTFQLGNNTILLCWFVVSSCKFLLFDFVFFLLYVVIKVFFCNCVLLNA
jgi:hypothetical protein